VVQGGREVGEALVGHRDVGGVFFTGSYATGRAINRALADHPEKILALEMGGNNPLVVHEVSDVAAAAYAIVHSAYLTSGQRCSCARRLIVTARQADAVIEAVRELVRRLIVGDYTMRPEPFMGPVISDRAADQILYAQEGLLAAGARVIEPARRMEISRAFVSPGLLDVSEARERPDEEIFGPVLQVVRVRDFDEAIVEANRTAYGLAAGLLCDDRSLYERFWGEVRAGVVNFNRPLTGASGLLPFGGVGFSGNHRPSAYFAADYCSYPVASLEAERVVAPPAALVGFKA
jgi:succinylglutamic semialdehyde dehydrogenase